MKPSAWVPQKLEKILVVRSFVNEKMREIYNFHGSQGLKYSEMKKSERLRRFMAEKLREIVFLVSPIGDCVCEIVLSLVSTDRGPNVSQTEAQKEANLRQKIPPQLGPNVCQINVQIEVKMSARSKPQNIC